jgi:hypothetical protein
MSDRKYLISSEEWDFSKCPKEELEECWWYEFKRELPHAHQVITKWRQICKKQTFDEFLKLAHMTHGHLYGFYEYLRLAMLISPESEHLYAFCSEWPKHPFLSIPDAERSRRLKQLSSKAESLAAQLTPTEPNLLDSMQSVMGLRQNVEFQINWQKSDRELLSFFAAWLVTHRPYKKKINTSIRRLQAGLKALGVLRILKVCNNDWEKIKNGDWLGDSHLPRAQAEWIKARARAEKIIENIS